MEEDDDSGEDIGGQPNLNFNQDSDSDEKEETELTD